MSDDYPAPAAPTAFSPLPDVASVADLEPYLGAVGAVRDELGAMFEDGRLDREHPVAAELSRVLDELRNADHPTHAAYTAAARSGIARSTVSELKSARGSAADRRAALRAAREHDAETATNLAAVMTHRADVVHRLELLSAELGFNAAVETYADLMGRIGSARAKDRKPVAPQRPSINYGKW